MQIFILYFHKKRNIFYKFKWKFIEFLNICYKSKQKPEDRTLLISGVGQAYNAYLKNNKLIKSVKISWKKLHETIIIEYRFTYQYLIYLKNITKFLDFMIALLPRNKHMLDLKTFFEISCYKYASVIYFLIKYFVPTGYNFM